MTMALLSESEVVEAQASASGKLLKVQECALPGRTRAEGLLEGGGGTSLQAGAAFEEQRRRHGVDPLAGITPRRGLRTMTVAESVCLSGSEHCSLGKSGASWVVCPIKHTFGI